MAADKPVKKFTLRKPPKKDAPVKAKTGTESPRKGESGTKPGEKSERSKFREIEIDHKVLARIKTSAICTPMGSAMRVANRSPEGKELREKEANYRGFSRPPLYTDIPQAVVNMIGERAKDKLTFIAAAMSVESMPPPVLPEVAFCGRSNVGKSSVINAVTLSTTVRSSDKPGMTQTFNFYVLPRRLLVADLPGYGFAFADPRKMETWKMLMDQYMSKRKPLKRIFLLIDARHGLKKADEEFMERLEKSRCQFQLVMTKCDLVQADDLARRYAIMAKHLEQSAKCIKTIRMVSAYTGAGLLDLASDLYQLSNKPNTKNDATPQMGGKRHKDDDDAGDL
ncbi:P-loop containing nucleoside triphosphate hydrolase protein [Baffinella frigidus]|nr:P-loop containing nucleoside triphosphate hydrolase protein [Cryptophyta sp. CCMP2293]